MNTGLHTEEPSEWIHVISHSVFELQLNFRWAKMRFSPRRFCPWGASDGAWARSRDSSDFRKKSRMPISLGRSHPRKRLSEATLLWQCRAPTARAFVLE